MKPITRNAAIVALALAAAPAAASLPAAEETSYGYLRTVEGPGRVVQAASGAQIEVEPNYPVLAGDLLEIEPGGRLELSLPDFNVVRLGGGSELMLDRLALSAETEDGETALRLLRGEIQFLVHDLLPVAERPRVDTANATIYLQGSGSYRIATDGYGWTEVVVRRGFAEIATEAGSSVLRGGEQAWIEGGRWPRIDIELAGDPDDLERWGAELDGELAAYDEPPVEEHLAYASRPLARHGSWVTDDGYRAWRPAVGAGWRPYETGYWADTPNGMLWVSSEPWAWVTYHYGSWVPSPSYGWVWRPGIRFAPAWVYWYWGPSYVAWVPVGYYSHHYANYGRGFRFGIHGWAGGSWDHFADWTFCASRSYRRRDLRQHVRRGHQLARDTRSRSLERGLISTDSRREARQRASLRDRSGRPGGETLPDVTAFVARRRDLSPEVSHRVFSDRRAVARGDLWDRPERVGGESAAGRTGAPRARAAGPAGDGTERLEAWRRESGRLRAGDSPTARSAAPRARPPATPGDRATDPARGWQERGARPVPRGVRPTPEGSRRGEARPITPQARGESRPPVVRRVWEGIRDRQRAQPSTSGPTAGAPAPRDPGTASPQARRRAPSARPAPTPSRRAPDAQPRRSPERPPPAAQRRGSESSRQTPSTERRAEPPRRSLNAGRAAPSRSQPSTRSSGGGSRKSAAASSKRSSGRSSSARSTGKGSARRRPPS